MAPDAGVTSTSGTSHHSISTRFTDQDEGRWLGAKQDPTEADREANEIELDIEAKEGERGRRPGFSGPSFCDNEFESPSRTGSRLPPYLAVHAANDEAYTGHYNSNAPQDTHLTLPPHPRSDSGRSDFSFRSIKTVNDRGTQAHAECEQESEPTPCSSQLSPSQHPASILSGQNSQRHARPRSQSARLSTTSNRSARIGQDDVSPPPSSEDRWAGCKIDVETVANEMNMSSQRSAFGKKYLPLNELCDILSPTVVRTLLDQTFGKDKVPLYEREVLGTSEQSAQASSLPPKRRRIFAILILMEEVGKLRDFIDADIDDTCLPLVCEQRGGPRGEWALYRNQDEPTECFPGWTSRAADKFDLYQEVVHVPFFQFPGDVISFYDLDHSSVLPFIHYDKHEVGGYGSVKRVMIHPAHHNHGSTMQQKLNHRGFAVKQLHTQSPEAYFNEVSVYETLGIVKPGSLPDHLMQLQLTYRHGADYFLVFAWADGNLKQFWKGHRADPSSFDQVRWFFSQCWGIARGLRKIHHVGTSQMEGLDAYDTNLALLCSEFEKQWGRHGDIKPENILWFENYEEYRNHLVISDFGLTQFNSTQSKSKVLQEKILGYSGTYRPPDLHLDEEISQRYDIWSLGCVFLEFVSWFLLGYRQTVHDFQKARLKDELESQVASEDKFFGVEERIHGTQKKKRAVLKKSVMQWIDRLHQSEYCSEPLHALLDLIQFTMLVPHSQDRWQCDMVRDVLKGLYEKCIGDPEFAVRGSPGAADPYRYDDGRLRSRMEIHLSNIRRSDDSEEDHNATSALAGFASTSVVDKAPVPVPPPISLGNHLLSTNENVQVKSATPSLQTIHSMYSDTSHNTSSSTADTTPNTTQRSVHNEMQMSEARCDGVSETESPLKAARPSLAGLSYTMTPVSQESSSSNTHGQPSTRDLPPQALTRVGESPNYSSKTEDQISERTGCVQDGIMGSSKESCGRRRKILSWLKRLFCQG